MNTSAFCAYQLVFFLQNSLDNFWSKRYFDAVISLIWPCHLAFLTLSFKRDDSIKVPFWALKSAKFDGKSQFCVGLMMGCRFSALYIASKRGGCFVKKVRWFFRILSSVQLAKTIASSVLDPCGLIQFWHLNQWQNLVGFVLDHG